MVTCVPPTPRRSPHPDALASRWLGVIHSFLVLNAEDCMNKIRIAVAGASGRMGRMLIESILKAPDTALVAAFEQPDSPFIGKDAGELERRGCLVAWPSATTWPRASPRPTA